MTDVIRVARSYDVPPSSLWAAIVEPPRASKWLGTGDLQPTEGHVFTLTQPARGVLGGEVRCTMLHVDSDRTVQFTWESTRLHGSTSCRLSVIATPGGCRLEVTHAGFEGASRLVRLLFTIAWHKALWLQLPSVL